VIITGAVILFSLFLLLNGWTEEGVRLVIRWSARLSIICFCLAFGARAIHLWGRRSITFWLLMNRKYLGVSFAILHLIHLGFLGLLQYSFHPVFTKAAATSLFAGGLAYLFVVLMLLTSFDRFANLITKQQWKRLHFIGGYWIWAIFVSTYSKGVLRGEYWDAPFLGFLILILLLRLWCRFRKKEPAHATVLKLR
jgi:hypothetical protein